MQLAAMHRLSSHSPREEIRQPDGNWRGEDENDARRYRMSFRAFAAFFTLYGTPSISMAVPFLKSLLLTTAARTMTSEGLVMGCNEALLGAMLRHLEDDTTECITTKK